MWFDSKYRIRRGTKTYPRAKKDTDQSQNYNKNGSHSDKPRKNIKKNLHKHYDEVQEDIYAFLKKLDKVASISYPKVKKIVLVIIQDLLEASYFAGWVKVLNIQHKFEFYLRFMTLLKLYHDIRLGDDETIPMKQRIQNLPFPPDLREKLIKLYEIRNNISHEIECDLSPEEKIRVVMMYFQSLFFFLEKEIKPAVDIISKSGIITQVDYVNLMAEIKIYIHNLFMKDYPNNKKYIEDISIVLNKLF